MTEKEIQTMHEKARKQLRTGQPLFGKGGAFAPILKEFLETALEAEMNGHLSDEEREKGNKRNGKGTKTVKSDFGTCTINVPQDRKSNFDPQIVKKRETILAEGLKDRIIGLYGLGMSYRSISDHIEEMYDMKISSHTLQEITDQIIPAVKKWQNRPLNAIYPLVWLDAMHYKVKDGGHVQSKALYNILGINKDGKKELLGTYLGENEGAKYWLQVLSQLENRGVRDILIACTDNLKGFSEAIATIFPKTEIQSCIVHQIRASLRYIGAKNKKEFLADLKVVYKAPSKEMAEVSLDRLAEKWEGKYPVVIRSWRDNWDKLSTYFSYSEAIRHIMYTTNAIEGYHRQIRKITKTKGAFPNDIALLKLVYLASKNIAKKWDKSIPNWGLTAQQLFIKFGDRMPLDGLTVHTA